MSGATWLGFPQNATPVFAYLAVNLALKVSYTREHPYTLDVLAFLLAIMAITVFTITNCWMALSAGGIVE